MSLTDPPRMFDAKETPAELRSLLAMARADRLGYAATERVLAGVEAGLGGAELPSDASSGSPTGASGPETGASAGSPSGAGGTLAAAVVAAAVIAGGIWYATGPQSEPEAPPAWASPTTIVDRTETPRTTDAAAPTLDETDEGAGVRGEVATGGTAPAASSRRASDPASSGSGKPPSAADLAEEHRLLRSARAALADNPQRALSLTAEHEGRFPNGVLAQEREVIAIEALARLGKKDAAQSRADRFSADYPDSPHRDRVEETPAGQGAARP